MIGGIQLGHGMRGYTESLIEAWGNGTVILGPRNFKSGQKDGSSLLAAFSNKLRKLNAETYIDPQLFGFENPQKNLSSFPHCRACAGDLPKNYRTVIDELVSLNKSASTAGLILPAHTQPEIDGKWALLQREMIDYACGKWNPETVFATIALTSDALRNPDTVTEIISQAEKWPTSGIYLVSEHPHDEYLSNDTLWLLNYLLLAAGLKRAGKKVFAGYASHQQLNLVVAKCDAIFSGGFLNTRHFKTDTFMYADDDTPSQRARWYYAPHLLSEFRTVTLDVAFARKEKDDEQRAILDSLAPPQRGSRYADILFEGAMPSQTAYSERDSFLHYIDSLHYQCSFFSKSTYKDTLAEYRQYLQVAASAIEGLREKGIYDRNRSYLACMDASESALLAFDSEMGYQMSMDWNVL